MESEGNGKKILDKKAAHAKLEYFCAYQERSQQEVRDKLYSYGLHSTEVEEVISELISSNYLNEARFAFAYTLGKFRIKNWGKIKIREGLKLKRVGDNLIKKALNEINPVDYERTLKSLMIKKAALLKEKESFKRQQKLILYGISKGYERDLVFDCLKSNDLLKI
ncbi:MAG TPA: regulatory protein RecX [Pedobacter sp.]|jgi:regulatory protein